MHQNEELLAQRPELGATLAGEVRLLRSINTIVISEAIAWGISCARTLALEW